MWLVVAGLLMVVLKLAGIGPLAGWSWWLVLAPFGLAALWWQLADSAGWTQRAAMERADRKVQRRREARLEELGLRPVAGAPRRTPPAAAADPAGAEPVAKPTSDPTRPRAD